MSYLFFILIPSLPLLHKGEGGSLASNLQSRPSIPPSPYPPIRDYGLAVEGGTNPGTSYDYFYTSSSILEWGDGSISISFGQQISPLGQLIFSIFLLSIIILFLNIIFMYHILIRHILNYNYKDISSILIKLFGNKNKIKIEE